MADFPGYPNSNLQEISEAKLIMHESGIIAQGDGNYEITPISKHVKLLKTFNRPTHTGLLFKYDPTGLPLTFE
jgi:hypothetical protein